MLFKKGLVVLRSTEHGYRNRTLIYIPIYMRHSGVETKRKGLIIRNFYIQLDNFVDDESLVIDGDRADYCPSICEGISRIKKSHTKATPCPSPLGTLGKRNPDIGQNDKQLINSKTQAVN